MTFNLLPLTINTLEQPWLLTTCLTWLCPSLGPWIRSPSSGVVIDKRWSVFVLVQLLDEDDSSMAEEEEGEHETGFLEFVFWECSWGIFDPSLPSIPARARAPCILLSSSSKRISLSPSPSLSPLHWPLPLPLSPLTSSLLSTASSPSPSPSPSLYLNSTSSPPLFSSSFSSSSSSSRLLSQ